MPGTGDIPDPFGSYNFLVEIDGITRAAFHEVSGVTSTVDVIEHREGGENLTMRKIPAQTKYANLVLKWGITDDLMLYKWHQDVIDGKPNTRRHGSIVLLDRQRNEVARWNFVRAWPTKYDAPAFNAEGSDVGIETLELAHEGLVRVR